MLSPIRYLHTNVKLPHICIGQQQAIKLSQLIPYQSPQIPYRSPSIKQYNLVPNDPLLTSLISAHKAKKISGY